jgi:hypothetical protein
MTSNNSPHACGNTFGPPLFEFVDEAHEVTEEERKRPRFGRPIRSQNHQPESSETNNDGAETTNE